MRRAPLYFALHPNAWLGAGRPCLYADSAKLKQKPGKDIAIVGGAKIARAIGSLGLIDEYRLWFDR